IVPSHKTPTFSAICANLTARQPLTDQAMRSFGLSASQTVIVATLQAPRPFLGAAESGAFAAAQVARRTNPGARSDTQLRMLPSAPHPTGARPGTGRDFAAARRRPASADT